MSRSRSSLVDASFSAPDDELARSAAAGDREAFEELYRRHSQAAWRVAQAVTLNPDDAADAVAEAFTRVFQTLPAGPLASGQPFRPYLLAATRNIAIDGLRKGGRHRPIPVAEQPDVPTTAAGPSESLLAQLDASLVAAAFRTLPERWRSVLWLTEVEGMKPQDAAPLLGLSANGASQLAVRARAGLRERFLQAHVSGLAERDCRYTAERLGAYVGGALSAREIAKVDQHLAGCEPCQSRLAELQDVGRSLRLAAIPLPLGLATMTIQRWKLTSTVSSIVSHTSAGAARLLKAERPLQVASAVLFSLGIISAAVLAPSSQPLIPKRGNQPTALSQPFDQVEGTSIVRTVDYGAPLFDAPGPVVSATMTDSGAGPLAPEGGSAAHTDTPPTPTTSTTLTPLVQVKASVNVGPAHVTAGVGSGDGSCTGAAVNGTGTGCQSEGSGGTATVSTGGTLVGDHSVSF